MVKIPIRGSFL